MTESLGEMNLYRVSIRNAWVRSPVYVVAAGWDDAAWKAREHDGAPESATEVSVTDIEYLGPANEHALENVCTDWRARAEDAETDLQIAVDKLAARRQ